MFSALSVDFCFTNFVLVFQIIVYFFFMKELPTAVTHFLNTTPPSHLYPSSYKLFTCFIHLKIIKVQLNSVPSWADEATKVSTQKLTLLYRKSAAPTLTIYSWWHLVKTLIEDYLCSWSVQDRRLPRLSAAIVWNYHINALLVSSFYRSAFIFNSKNELTYCST